MSHGPLGYDHSRIFTIDADGANLQALSPERALDHLAGASVLIVGLVLNPS